MKKLFALVMAVALALGFAACGGGSESETTGAPAEASTAVTTTVPVVTDPNFGYNGLFKRLEGYWNTEALVGGGHFLSFVSFIVREGKPGLYTGVYEGEGSDFGALIGGRGTGENTAELAFLFPAITEEGELPTHPELTAVVSLDFSGLDSEIDIKINNYGDGVWRAYTYGGADFQEAQQSAFRGIFENGG